MQVEYSIALQSGKKPYQEGDRAPNPLFNYVNEAALSKPTYSTFIALLVSACDYNSSVGSFELPHTTGTMRQIVLGVPAGTFYVKRACNAFVRYVRESAWLSCTKKSIGLVLPSVL